MHFTPQCSAGIICPLSHPIYWTRPAYGVGKGRRYPHPINPAFRPSRVNATTRFTAAVDLPTSPCRRLTRLWISRQAEGVLAFLAALYDAR